MINALAFLAILSAGIYLVALGAAARLSPERAQTFLSLLASSAAAHYIEVLVRSLVGAAFVIYAPMMNFAGVFAVFGWLLVITTAGLAVMPWRWHNRFAVWAMPYVFRSMPLISITSLAGGLFVIASLITGPGVEDFSANVGR